MNGYSRVFSISSLACTLVYLRTLIGEFMDLVHQMLLITPEPGVYVTNSASVPSDWPNRRSIWARSRTAFVRCGPRNDYIQVI